MNLGKPSVLRRAILALALCLTLPLAFGAQAAVSTNDYIVVFHDSVIDPAIVADHHASAFGADINFVYSMALKGYAATIPDGVIAAVEADPRVAYIELDQVATLTAQTLPWGINKVDADLSSTKAGDGTGAVTNVHAYVIDTGVDPAHTDLNATFDVNYAGGPNTDCNGHGTHVAGTVGARDNTQDVVGVAPGVRIHGVKVLGCSGSGSYSGVIAGVDWVTKNAIKPAIANMSLGGPVSDALDTAVKNSAASGIFYALAAGNDGANACNSSPARTGAGTNNGIATVAATDSVDKETSWSNYGSCVDIWAPGASILSTKKGGGTTTMSGTSMSSPHVGGGGALYLSSNTSASPSTVESSLKSTATTTLNKSKDGRTIIRENVATY